MALSVDTTPAKHVTVLRNGDSKYQGRKFIISRRRYRTFDSLLSDITHQISAPFGAVRRLYTPKGSRQIQGIDDLEGGATYVAGGTERFKKIEYSPIQLNGRHGVYNSNLKPGFLADDPPPLVLPKKNRKYAQRSAQFHKVRQPVQFTVFRNGLPSDKGAKFLLKSREMKSFETVLSIISFKIRLVEGAVRKLYTVDGNLLNGPEEITDGGHYVACGHRRFMPGLYGEIPQPPKLQKLPAIKRNRYVSQQSPRTQSNPLPAIQKKATEASQKTARSDKDSPAPIAEEKGNDPETDDLIVIVSRGSQVDILEEDPAIEPVAENGVLGIEHLGSNPTLPPPVGSPRVQDEFEAENREMSPRDGDNADDPDLESPVANIHQEPARVDTPAQRNMTPFSTNRTPTPAKSVRNLTPIENKRSPTPVADGRVSWGMDRSPTPPIAVEKSPTPPAQAERSPSPAELVRSPSPVEKAEIANPAEKARSPSPAEPIRSPSPAVKERTSTPLADGGDVAMGGGVTLEYRHESDTMVEPDVDDTVTGDANDGAAADELVMTDTVENGHPHVDEVEPQPTEVGDGKQKSVEEEEPPLDGRESTIPDMTTEEGDPVEDNISRTEITTVPSKSKLPAAKKSNQAISSEDVATKPSKASVTASKTSVASKKVNKKPSKRGSQELITDDGVFNARSGVSNSNHDGKFLMNNVERDGPSRADNTDEVVEDKDLIEDKPVDLQAAEEVEED